MSSGLELNPLRIGMFVCRRDSARVLDCETVDELVKHYQHRLRASPLVASLPQTIVATAFKINPKVNSFQFVLIFIVSYLKFL